MKDRQPYLAASALCTLSSIAWFYFGMTNRDPLDMNAAIWAMIVAIWVKQQ